MGVADRAVRARQVVLASGGFEWNERLRAAYLPFPVRPISAPSNEGDGLRLGLRAGASVADMTAVWGVPVICAPAQVYDGARSGRMGNVELTLPGSLAVNAAGERFVNEAANYHDSTGCSAPPIHEPGVTPTPPPGSSSTRPTETATPSQDRRPAPSNPG